MEEKVAAQHLNYQGAQPYPARAQAKRLAHQSFRPPPSSWELSKPRPPPKVAAAHGLGRTSDTLNPQTPRVTTQNGQIDQTPRPKQQRTQRRSNRRPAVEPPSSTSNACLSTPSFGFALRRSRAPVHAKPKPLLVLKALHDQVRARVHRAATGRLFFSFLIRPKPSSNQCQPRSRWLYLEPTRRQKPAAGYPRSCAQGHQIRRQTS